MALSITKANNTHYQYFKAKVLEEGVGYVVSDRNSIVGLFSFLFLDQSATLNFTFVFNASAIQLCLDTFLKDYPSIQKIQYLGNQNLSKFGFVSKIYTRK